MFIGRESELKFLQSKYEEKNGQLIFLYGRRRVGKTETLKEFCKGKKHIFYSCTQTTDQVQLLKFSQQLLNENIPAKKFVKSFNDWETAFKAILDLPYGNNKKLVVIDEFPYMCYGNSSIPSILQNLWDLVFKDSNVMIILCGSAMSFIEKEILAEKNPLYGRATGIYKMEKMGFYDAIKFFHNYSSKDKIIAYSILGGIPHYLIQWDQTLSIEENIKNKILTKGSILYSEVEFLLHQELRETAIYNSIIETIALGNTKLSEISQKSLINDNSKTSVYIKNLIELGIVEREFSIDANIKEQANLNRGIYHLTDNFFKFWYAFVFGNLSQLEDGDIDGVYNFLIKSNLDRFASYTFENVCNEFLREKQKNGDFLFRFSKIGRWFGKTTIKDTNAKNGVRIDESEIDILALDKNYKNYLVGECKFQNSLFSYDDYLNTKSKLLSLQDNVKFYYAFFSLNGFDEKLIKEKDNYNISLYGIDDVVDYKK